MVKKLRKLKRVRHVRDRAAEVLAEKAADLNPLVDRPAGVPTLEDVPRITNENISEHREEVLKGARKYIYPLRHSKRTIIKITLTVITAAIIGLFVYCYFGLYKFYQYNTFLYRVTQVVPFPIAKA